MNEESTKQPAILVAIASDATEMDACNRSLDELANLLDTAGGQEYARFIQIRPAFDARTCIGAGKVREIRDCADAADIHLVIFDFELSPSQIRNLEDDLGNSTTVLDRSMLILDIFAAHAATGEGKLQVELAQLKYTAPRLIGSGNTLSRQGGGIGTRGPGESQLETDKRHLKERIRALESQIADLAATRRVIRSARDRSGIPRIVLAGYTNAGKSTLMNTLTNAGVLAKDCLFATLDPTTRRLELPNGTVALLTDTVGFISKLPHHLIHAFRSTLEEVSYADLILLVCDASDPQAQLQIQVTESLLKELQAGDVPVLRVWNKCDRLPDFVIPADQCGKTDIYISATDQSGLDSLLCAIVGALEKNKKRLSLRFPYSAQSELSALYQDATVEDVAWEPDAIHVVAVLDQRARGKYAAYLETK